MTQLIQQSAESSMTIGNCIFQPTKVTASGLDGYLIVEARFGLVSERTQGTSHQSGTSVKEMANRYEHDPRKAAALARARERIADRLAGAPTFSLAQLRLQRGLSQTSLGQIMGVAQPQVARIERGDDSKISTLEKLAAALNVSFVEVCAAAYATRKARGSASEE